MNQGNVRNKVNFSKVEPRPSNDNILSQFLGSIGSIGQGVGEAVGQVGTGIAGGIGQGVNLIGQGIGEMNKTPEGRLALRELVGAALRGVGQEDLGTGIQQYAQRVYQPEAQRALYETKQKAEAEKAEKESKKQITKLEDDYRKEYNTKKIVKDSKEIDSAISRMDNVWNKYQSNPNPKSKNALDQALVITFNKMLDPGSVVRESEFARTPTGQSLISRIQGASEKLAEGGVGLTDAERDEIIVVAKQLQEGQMMQLEKEKQFYRELAEQRGLNIENILGKNKTKVPKIPKRIKSITDTKRTTPSLNIDNYIVRVKQ
jgi:hypothetical protein